MSRPPSNPAKDGDLLTSREIAARYRVTEVHITNLASRGDIPGIKIGSIWRFNPERVHEALVNRTRTIRQPRKEKGAKR